MTLGLASVHAPPPEPILKGPATALVVGGGPVISEKEKKTAVLALLEVEQCGAVPEKDKFGGGAPYLIPETGKQGTTPTSR